MFIWTGAQGRAQAAPSGESTPLLRHLSGPYAPRIAGLWPAPHASFIGAPADRRHLVCLALSRAEGQIDPELAEALLGAPLKRAVRQAVADAPAGLARALGHVGETAWEAQDYALLVDLLRVPATARSIQHAKAISPHRVRVLAALPAALREAGFADPQMTPARARLLGEVYEAVLARDGEAATGGHVRAWAAGTSLNDRLERIRDSLLPELPAAPFPGTPILRLLGTKAALRDAAGRYRNCLATSYLASASDGDAAFYEWTGEPGAVVQVTKDGLFGWALTQARGRDNAEVAELARGAIAEELRGWGVQVGRTYWSLNQALCQAQARTFSLPELEEAIDDLFED